MNILTDEEIKATLDKVSCCLEDRDITYSRAIEAAVLSKLAEQAEEPVAWRGDAGALCSRMRDTLQLFKRIGSGNPRPPRRYPLRSERLK